MDMKYFKVYRIQFFFIITFLFLVMLSVMVNGFLSIHSFRVQIPRGIESRAYQEVNEYVQQVWVSSNISLSHLCDKTMGRFEWIQAIQVERLPDNNSAHITIFAHIPLYLINNDYVVTSTGILLKRDVFKPYMVDNLHRLYVISDGDNFLLSDRCKQFIISVSSLLVSDYFCVWENENNIWFIDKQQPKFSILSQLKALPDECLLQQCAFLKHELVKRCAFDMPGTKAWVADIRFKDQIVLSQKIGGMQYGTYI